MRLPPLQGGKCLCIRASARPLALARSASAVPPSEGWVLSDCCLRRSGSSVRQVQTLPHWNLLRLGWLKISLAVCWHRVVCNAQVDSLWSSCPRLDPQRCPLLSTLVLCLSGSEDAALTSTPAKLAEDCPLTHFHASWLSGRFALALLPQAGPEPFPALPTSCPPLSART